jgi:hypothetical protein
VYVKAVIVTLGMVFKLAKGLANALSEKGPVRPLHVPVVILDCRTRLQDTDTVRNSALGIFELSASISTMVCSVIKSCGSVLETCILQKSNQALKLATQC